MIITSSALAINVACQQNSFSQIAVLSDSVFAHEELYNDGNIPVLFRIQDSTWQLVYDGGIIIESDGINQSINRLNGPIFKIRESESGTFYYFDSESIYYFDYSGVSQVVSIDCDPTLQELLVIDSLLVELYPMGKALRHNASWNLTSKLELSAKLSYDYLIDIEYWNSHFIWLNQFGELLSDSPTLLNSIIIKDHELNSISATKDMLFLWGLDKVITIRLDSTISTYSLDLSNYMICYGENDLITCLTYDGYLVEHFKDDISDRPNITSD